MTYLPSSNSPPKPTGPSPGIVAVGAFIIGAGVATAFHDVASLRPFVPPIFSTAATLACGDIDAYVRHVKDLSDHHVRQDTFGIHRQKTVDAVNELYDRARCGAQQDTFGRETYQQLRPGIVVDSNDPPVPPTLAAAAPVIATPTAAPTTTDPRPAAFSGSLRSRRHVLINNDGTLDAMQPTPAPEPAHCTKPGQVNYGFPPCR